MLPCESIELILLSVGSLQSSLHQPSDLGRPPKNVHYERASVLHISNSAKHSFIAEKLLLKLLRLNYGSRSSAFKIDNNTIVNLQWHYPGSSRMETTTHFVVRDSRFQIILRKEDWEQPIRHWLMRNFSEEQLRERGILRPLPKQESESPVVESTKSESEGRRAIQSSETRPDGDSEVESVDSESSEHLSRSSIASTAPTVAVYTGRHESGLQAREESERRKSESRDGSTPKDESQDEGSARLKSECHDDSNDSEWSGIDTDSQEDDTDDEIPEEDAYWHWLTEKRRWFHENEDGSIMWFPKLV